MAEKFTDVLEEKIYCVKDTDGKDKIHEQVEAFFKEVHARRRNDPVEGGLQAAAVIYPHVFAAKVNEQDGYGAHMASHVNLTKFINGDTNYLTDDGMRFFANYQNELRQLHTNGVQMSVLGGDEHMMVAINATTDINSIFQLEVIKNVLDVCSELKKSGGFKTIEIGLMTPCVRVAYGELDSDKHKQFATTIANEEKIVSSR